LWGFLFVVGSLWLHVIILAAVDMLSGGLLSQAFDMGFDVYVRWNVPLIAFMDVSSLYISCRVVKLIFAYVKRRRGRNSRHGAKAGVWPEAAFYASAALPAPGPFPAASGGGLCRWLFLRRLFSSRSSASGRHCRGGVRRLLPRPLSLVKGQRHVGVVYVQRGGVYSASGVLRY